MLQKDNEKVVDDMYPYKELTEKELKFHKEYNNISGILTSGKAIFSRGLCSIPTNISNEALIVEYRELINRDKVGMLYDKRLEVLKKELNKRLLTNF